MNSATDVPASASSASSAWYKTLKQSPLTPPSWVFPIAWTILYILIIVSGVVFLSATTDIEYQFPEFRRYRAIIDELNRVVTSGDPIRSQLFAEQAPIMDLYFKAVFGSLTHKGSELQQAALKYLETLDPHLHQHLQHGLAHHYLSRSGPTRL